MVKIIRTYDANLCIFELNRIIVLINEAINFDNMGKIEPSHSIQLNRGLLFGAIIQALLVISQTNKNYHSKMALNPELQQLVAEEWAQYQPKGSFPEELLEYFKGVNWINYYSGGEQIFQNFGKFFDKTAS